MNLKKRKSLESFVTDIKILKRHKLSKLLSMHTSKHGKNCFKISSKTNLNICLKVSLKG